MNGEEADRHPRRHRRQTSENTRFRTARVQDLRSLAAQEATQLHQAGEIPPRPDRPPNVAQWDEPGSGLCCRRPERPLSVRCEHDLVPLG